MKTLTIGSLREDPGLYKEAADVLEAGGLVIVPTSGGYKLLADLASPQAITAMLQAKRRVKNAPALVFVPGPDQVSGVVAGINDKARALMTRLWPGAVTLLFEASEDLHPKVRKPLTKAKGWLGVRQPDDEVAAGVVAAFGRPLLVSSANLAAKRGANSVAQVKKNFGRTAELLIDAGDLPEAPKSTLVNTTGDGAEILRSGAVPAEQVEAALAG